MFPALFITDITNGDSRAGDWQQGTLASRVAHKPDDVYGTWKSATRLVDKTTSPFTVTTAVDPDPAKNNWSLGAGSDTPSSGFAALKNEGFGAEASWSAGGVGLQSGHAYRLQFMVHDGDQNKTGGDSGEACVNVRVPGTDLGIDKSARLGTNTVNSNPLKYFITVTNYGPFVANSVRVTDALPTNMTFVSCRVTSFDGGTDFRACS